MKRFKLFLWVLKSENMQHFIALNICGNGWIYTQAASVQKMTFQYFEAQVGRQSRI